MAIKRINYILLIFLLIQFFSCNKKENRFEEYNDNVSEIIVEKTIDVNENRGEAHLNINTNEIDNVNFKELIYSFEEIKDIEKIRWINCGEDNYDLPKIDKLTFSFRILPSERYFKIFDLQKNKYNTLGEGENFFLTEGKFYLFYEFKNNYFVTNFSESYYNYLLKQKDTYFIYENGYKLGSFNFDNENKYIREDGKAFSINDLCTKYLKKQDNSLYTIIEPIEKNEVFIGTVSITDNNQTIKERGNHFLYFNQETSSFYSDSVFEKKGYEFGDTGNDSFLIKVLKYNETEKLLLLDTPTITRPYVPMEDFFTSETDKVIISKSYEKRNEMINCYQNPNFTSEIIKELSGKNNYYVKIIEAKENLEEHNNEISKWVKVKFEDDFEGWVWGRNVTLFDWSIGYDYEKVKRYVKYNTIK